MASIMGADKSPAKCEGYRADQPDPRDVLLNAPMSRFQIVAVLVTLALCALDGFDVLAITFAAPAILPEWGIDKAQLGYALSAGLLGMALGSLLISPLADSLGRRRILFISLALMISGTLWTALSHNLRELIASRVFTGLGIGAMIGVIFPLAAEYANSRNRDRAIAVLSMGYPLGGILGGLLSAALLASHGWRAIFFFAAAMGVVLTFAVWRFLLDPLALVVARPGSDGLDRANVYLKRCGHAPVAALPPPPGSKHVPIAALFETGMRRDTLIITLIYFLYMIPQFFMQTWLPTLVADIGLPPSSGALTSAFFSIGGLFAAMFIGVTALHIGIKRLEIGLLIGAALTIIGFSFLPPVIARLMLGAAVCGFFVMGGMIGLYAIIARTFPVHLRASGNGFVIGIGRFGSILPPMLAGMMFAAGIGRETISVMMAAPALLAMLLLISFRVRPPTIA
jgi:AAHS family 4-hydroxybenzoate transporter-like MFS transporter